MATRCSVPAGESRGQRTRQAAVCGVTELGTTENSRRACLGEVGSTVRSGRLHGGQSVPAVCRGPWLLRRHPVSLYRAWSLRWRRGRESGNDGGGAVL